MTDTNTPPLLTPEQIEDLFSDGLGYESKLTIAREIESAVRAPLLAEIERERQSRLAAQVRVEQLHAEVARLEPMRQRAADIERLKAALAASCDDERHQLYEAGPGGGCPRALAAEYQVKCLISERDEARAVLGTVRETAKQYRVALREISWSNDSSWQSSRADEALDAAQKELTNG